MRYVKLFDIQLVDFRFYQSHILAPCLYYYIRKTLGTLPFVNPTGAVICPNANNHSVVDLIVM